jgi:hypothetical protein
LEIIISKTPRKSFNVVYILCLMVSLLFMSNCSGGGGGNDGAPEVSSPTITSFNPISGPVGTLVTITGTNLTGATSIEFHGTTATSFTVVNATQITATVPSGTTTGTITASTPGGTATSSGSFTVTTTPATGSYIADHTVAKDSVLRTIPNAYINTARTTFHVAYNHTSHGTHVSYGVYGLPGFKTGDATKFGVTMNAAAADPTKLDFHDNEIGGTYSDLSTADADWAAWRDQVRAYLDNAANADINVMMWSWCDITGHSVPSYLSSMQTLIDEYGSGGTKIGTGTGKTRTTSVTFIFMTGHAVGDANTGAGNPRDQAKLITDYCTAHGYYCIDYYAIDSHAMDDTYYEDVNDDAVSTTYGGNFYQDWQTVHILGTDWYNNLDSPGGSVSYGQHNTQHITANRKSFAFWWMLARIAGWDGNP